MEIFVRLKTLSIQLRVSFTYIVGLDSTEWKILRRYGHLRECIEQSAFADIWKPDDADLQAQTILRSGSQSLTSRHLHALAHAVRFDPNVTIPSDLI